jgi:hypothetical protein
MCVPSLLVALRTLFPLAASVRAVAVLISPPAPTRAIVRGTLEELVSPTFAVPSDAS